MLVDSITLSELLTWKFVFNPSLRKERCKWLERTIDPTSKGKEGTCVYTGRCELIVIIVDIFYNGPS